MPDPSSASEARFREWLTKFQPLLAKVVRGFAHSRQDEQELLQDVLVQLWASLPRFDGRCADSTWVYRVAFYTAMAWRRTARRRQSRHAEAIDLEALAAPPATDTARVEALYTAIHTLPPPDAALIMMHLDGLSYRAMAEVLGLSEAHVGTKLTRTRLRLGQLLKELLP